MASEIKRECISVGVAENGTNSVLVVSTDEDRVEHKSEIFELKDFMSGPSRMIFDEDEWVAGMWVSQTGKHYLSEVLGSCYTNATGNFVRTKITSSKLYKIWGLRDEAVYAVGSGGTYCMYDGRGWSERSVGEPVELHAIGGLSENSLICAGDNGYVAKWDGLNWTQIEIPTNAAIRCLYVVNDQLIYFGGYDGTCFRLQNNEFDELEAPNDSFYSIESWEGHIYYGAYGSGVLRLNGNALEPFKPTIAAADMKSGGNFLFVCGENKYARFDGMEWKVRPFT